MTKIIEKLGTSIVILLCAALLSLINYASHVEYNRIRYEIVVERNKTLDTVECYYHRQLFINQDAVPQDGDRLLVDETLFAGILWPEQYSYNKPEIEMYKAIPLKYKLKRDDTLTYKGYKSHQWGSSDDEYTLEQVVAHNTQNPSDKISLKPFHIKKRLYGVIIATHYQKKHGDLWLKSNKQQFMWKYNDLVVAGFGVGVISLIYFYGRKISILLKKFFMNCKMLYNNYKTRKLKN